MYRLNLRTKRFKQIRNLFFFVLSRLSSISSSENSLSVFEISGIWDRPAHAVLSLPLFCCEMQLLCEFWLMLKHSGQWTSAYYLTGTLGTGYMNLTRREKSRNFKRWVQLRRVQCHHMFTLWYVQYMMWWWSDHINKLLLLPLNVVYTSCFSFLTLSLSHMQNMRHIIISWYSSPVICLLCEF